MWGVKETVSTLGEALSRNEKLVRDRWDEEDSGGDEGPQEMVLSMGGMQGTTERSCKSY